MPEVQAGGLLFRTCLLDLLPHLLQLNGGLGLCIALLPLVLSFWGCASDLPTAQMPRLAQYKFLSQASGLGPGKLSFQYTSSVDSLRFVKHSSRANRAEAILWLPNGC